MFHVAAAIGYSDESGLPYRQALIRNHYVGRTFIEPSQAIRDFGVKLKLNPVKHLLPRKRESYFSFHMRLVPPCAWIVLPFHLRPVCANASATFSASPGLSACEMLDITATTVPASRSIINDPPFCPANRPPGQPPARVRRPA